MKLILKILMILTLSCANAMASVELTAEEKNSDFSQLVHLIYSSYGPLEFKQQYLGIDFKSLISKYRDLVDKTKNNREFYYLLLRFIAEFKDGHFFGSVPTDHVATLPIQFEFIENKIIIAHIDKSKNIPGLEYLNKGDELLSWNHRPIKEKINEIKPFIGEGSPLANKRLAVWALGSRKGKYLPIPNKPAEISVHSISLNRTFHLKLNWEYKGTPLDEYPNYLLAPKDDKQKPFKMQRYLGKTVSFAKTAINNEDSPIKNLRYSCRGETRMRIPNNATILQEKPFTAYYFPTEKGNIGYLRISHFSPQEKVEGEVYSRYVNIIKTFNKKTKGLIIDQAHNCGGSVEFLHKILSLFINKKFTPLQFRLLSTKAEYILFKEWYESMPHNSIERKNAKSIAQLIKSSWLDGKKLTPKTGIFTPFQIEPAKEVYQHPVVILIDEMSSSAGDSFPEMMRHHTGATLIGHQTNGAGGHVEEYAPLYYSGIKISLTKSLFYSPEGHAMENNGSKPDFTYHPSKNDFLNSFADYFKFSTSVLLEKIN